MRFRRKKGSSFGLNNVLCVYWSLYLLSVKHTNLFEVPGTPKEVVSERQVLVEPPKKPEAPPVTGTGHWPEASSDLSSALENIHSVGRHDS